MMTLRIFLYDLMHLGIKEACNFTLWFLSFRNHSLSILVKPLKEQEKYLVGVQFEIGRAHV